VTPTVATLCRQIGWTSGELARRAGVSPRTARRWVAGDIEPPELVREWLVKIAEAVLLAGSVGLAASQVPRVVP
jgi:transcriptional regulator with XRE-family HTH domain